MIASGDGPVADFCAALRQRWRDSGRDLPGVAREIQISRAQLYAILNGEIRRPPDFEGLVRPLVLACGGSPAELSSWRRRHEILVGVQAELRRSGARREPGPAQLPADVTGFSGRAAALAALAAATSPVVTISGVPGVGKTALAVHWAHSAASSYPDGQLYVDLRGFDPGEAVDPGVALRGFLSALAVEPHQVPPDRDAQAALFRSLSAGRRMVVLLDNARDADQVRPLLANGPAVRTIVTSRNRLTQLVAEVNAAPMVLDPPGHDEAVALLTTRAAMDPTEADAVVAACGRLPLALALVAARVRQDGFTSALADVDDVRAVFSWSYRALTPSAGRLFRLLGLVNGEDIALEAAAALAGDPVDVTRRAVRELVDASLLSAYAPGRFRLHDLLRAYARDLARRSDPPADHRRALTGLLNHYTDTAYRAELVLNPSRAPILPAFAPHADAAEPKQRLDIGEALAWLDTERAVLMSALRQAADEGLDRQAWQLGWALDTFLFEQRHWQDEGAAWAVALRAATALVDHPAAAQAHRFLAVVAGRLARFDEAHDHIASSVDLCAAAGDAPGVAETEFMLSYVCWLQGDRDGALTHAERSLKLWAELGLLAWEGKAGNAVGWYYAQLGDHRRAVTVYERALACERTAGDRANEAVVRDNLGQSRHALGDYGAAAEQFQAGLTLARQLADPVLEAQISLHLGDTCAAAGDSEAARSQWEQAHALLTEVGHPSATEAARRLQG